MEEQFSSIHLAIEIIYYCNWYNPQFLPHLQYLKHTRSTQILSFPICHSPTIPWKNKLIQKLHNLKSSANSFLSSLAKKMQGEVAKTKPATTNLLQSIIFPSYFLEFSSVGKENKISEGQHSPSRLVSRKMVNSCMISLSSQNGFSRSTLKSVLQQKMIKKHQDYFSICELSTSEVSLQSFRAADFRKQEKCKYIKKLKILEEALIKALQQNHELKMDQRMLFSQLQTKKEILELKNVKHIIDTHNLKSGKTDKNRAEQQDFTFKPTHKANKGSLLLKDNSRNKLGHKYSQRYCTVMPSPKNQSPLRQADSSAKDCFSKKSLPFNLLLQPQQTCQKNNSRNLAFNKTQRKINCQEKYSNLNFQEKNSIEFASIEDIWNQQRHLGSSKYWKSTAKTLID